MENTYIELFRKIYAFTILRTKLYYALNPYYAEVYWNHNMK